MGAYVMYVSSSTFTLLVRIEIEMLLSVLEVCVEKLCVGEMVNSPCISTI